MMRPSGLIACKKGEEIVRDLGIRSLPVDPFEIARQNDIIVQAKPDTAAGVSGLLMKAGNRFGIMYATHIPSEGYQRFSVAHELGHYFLAGHMDAILDESGLHQSRAGFTSADRYEIEADSFAAGLLMPQPLFLPALARAGVSIEGIEKLHDECKTSLVATAIRITQCTREPVAIILSIGNHIDYCFMSTALQELDGIDWLRKRQAVPSGTPTFEFNQNTMNVQRGARAIGESDLQDWFGGRRSIPVSEGVIGLGSYGKTLTVLYDIELPDVEEEEEEESLRESWTPRFRR